MHTMRDFSRRLSHFKPLGSAGKRIELVDRQVRRFMCQSRAAGRLNGGIPLAKGKPLSPESIPAGEWKGGK